MLIVENRVARLSVLFLGPGIIFEKVMTKTDLQYMYTILLVTCDLLVTHHPSSTISKIVSATSLDTVFVITCSKIISST